MAIPFTLPLQSQATAENKLTTVEDVKTEVENAISESAENYATAEQGQKADTALQNNATGNSLAIGNTTTATGNYTTAIGYGVSATGNYGIVLGSNGTTAGTEGIAIGAGTSATSGIAIGYNAVSSADGAIQLGQGTNNTAGTLCVALGSTSSKTNYTLLKSGGIIPSARLSEIMIVSDTAPTTETIGSLGDLYKDTSTGVIYKCTAVDSETPSYVWSEFGTGIDTSDFAKLSELNQFTGRNNFLDKTYFYTPPVVYATEITFVNNDFEYNVAPSSNTESTVSFKDKNGKGVGSLGLMRETDGNTTIAFHVRSQNGAWSQIGTTLRQIYTADGVLESRASVPANDANDDRIATTAWTNTKLESKQDTLTAGDGIAIKDNVISTTGGDSNLAALDDVTITDPTDGQVLTYNATDAVWKNTTSPSLKNTATGTEGALAIGDGSTGSGRGSTAIGAGSSTTEAYSVAVGHNAKANGGLIAIGNEATASSINAMAFGFAAKATGVGSLAVGQSITASGGGAIAIGSSNKAGGSNSISVGGSINNTSGQNSVRIGYNTLQKSTYDLTGNYGIGIGYNAYTTNQYGTAIGANANVKADYGIQIGSGSNTEANTLYVGLSSSSNYKLLDADGTIPAERLVNAPCSALEVLTGTAAPTTSTTGELGEIYIDTTSGNGYMCVNITDGTYTWKNITYTPTGTEYTLAAADWNAENNSIEVSIPGLTVGTPMWIAPTVSEDNSNEMNYTTHGIRLKAQQADSIVLSCTIIPTENISITIIK